MTDRTTRACGCVYERHPESLGLRQCVRRCAEHGGETEDGDRDVKPENDG